MLLAWLVACVAPPPCDDPALTCDAARPVSQYVVHLAGRPLDAADAAILQAALLSEANADPARSQRRVAAAAEGLLELEGLAGIDGARVRGERIYGALGGEGPLAEAPADVGTVLGRAVSEWARSEGDHLVLAESDIEGVLRYASLCREVQGGGALRLSIADRGVVYQRLVARFREGTSVDRSALLALGAGFWAARDAWRDASYDRQREFTVGAPLPPPMTANSLDYTLAIVNGDLPAHAANLHATLGPLPIEPADP